MRGVNVGGWLLQESYILRTDSLNSQGMIQAAMRRTMSDKAIDKFYQRYRDAFVSKADIDFLADQGFNCVRVPFHYDLFLTPAQRAQRRQAQHSTRLQQAYADSLAAWNDRGKLFTDPGVPGFRHLDDVLRWCGARNLYVVLDLHAAPGGQGTDHNINDNQAPLGLWKQRDAQGRHVYQDATVQLWRQLARRYRQDTRIAFYDLINEPHGLNPAHGLSNDNQELHDLYVRLLETVRGQQDQHLLMLEGNGYGNEYTNLTPDHLPAALRGNLVYNAHRYWCSNAAGATDPNPNQINLLGNLAAFRTRWQVPVWVGETGENSNEWFASAVAALNQLGVGWCHWNIKRVASATGLLSVPAYGNILTEQGRNQLLRNGRFRANTVNTGVLQALLRPLEPSRPLRGNTLPGLLEAAQYDLGRVGKAYQDTYSQRLDFLQPENWNLGHCYRNDGVDLSPTGDGPGPAYALDLLEPAEWVQYTVQVTRAGQFRLQARVANATAGTALVRLQLDGAPLLELAIPPTGPAGWTTLQVPAGLLPAGSHQLRVEVVQPGARLSWLRFETGTERLAPSVRTFH